MEYMTCLTIPTPDVEFYGKPVGELVRKGARIQADGKVKGHFPYVASYISVNDKTEGHYFPAWVNVKGNECEIVRCSDGTSAKGTLNAGPGDNFIVILMDDHKEYDIKVDGKFICHLDFSEAILEEKKGDTKMNAQFFDPGVCGLPITGHICRLNKENAKDTTAVTVEKALPAGTKLVNIITVASDDLAGGTSVTVGSGAAEDAYASEAKVTKGKTEVTDGKYVNVTSGTAKIKVGAGITEGTVDVFATVIRLTV